jgi:hypothetical protein
VLLHFRRNKGKNNGKEFSGTYRNYTPSSEVCLEKRSRIIKRIINVGEGTLLKTR